jgi:hypothetical protein
MDLPLNFKDRSLNYMNVLHRIIYGAKYLAEKGGISSSSSYHYARLQLAIFVFYLLAPLIILICTSYKISDEYIIYILIAIALIIDSLVGIYLKGVDLNLHITPTEQKKNVWAVNIAYLLMLLPTLFYIVTFTS